ncbi:hypothetical protein NXV57_19600 [Bacteroides thetaiotaomicron]|nr:hypothetical protein [Bacteroides thetaiotaomicron]
MEQEELALTGQHNLYNSLAAGISANLAGITKENIRKALSDFKGVEHRLEKVARVRGIDFINDSKATNVNSCWYALQSMTTKTVLILGGKDKGNDYTEIEDLVREKCSALVYLGLHNEKPARLFRPFRTARSRCADRNEGCSRSSLQAGKERRNCIVKPLLRLIRPLQELRRPRRSV